MTDRNADVFSALTSNPFCAFYFDYASISQTRCVECAVRRLIIQGATRKASICYIYAFPIIILKAKSSYNSTKTVLKDSHACDGGAVSRVLFWLPDEASESNISIDVCKENTSAVTAAFCAFSKGGCSVLSSVDMDDAKR